MVFVFLACDYFLFFGGKKGMQRIWADSHTIYNYFDFAGITGDATFLGDYKTGYANAAVPEEAFHSGHGSACILCGLGSERIGDQR